MDFSPLSEHDIEEMLRCIGLKKIDDLFEDIPVNLRNPPMNIGKGISELECTQKLQDLARKNIAYDAFFCGGGIYNHYIPPVVGELIHRGEFYTSYTPYQAEISQGMLQTIFEYQTSICNLTGMDAANASVYDGATALTESLMMAKAITRKNKFLILQPINPEYHQVIDTYAFASDYSVEYISINKLKDMGSSTDIGAVVIQNPNFFGELQDISYLVDVIRKKFSQAITIYVVVEASSLGILKRPGSFGIDIVCGDLQSLGLPMNFGGPTIGFISTTSKHMRKLPGRIVGRTKELHGTQEGYILTLQAREQHIRREKASSNICSNEALCMLSVQIYLSSMGYSGIRQNAELNIRNTNYLKRKIHELASYFIINFESPIYNEFLVGCKKGFSQKIEELCLMNNICPPLNLSEKMIKLLSIGSPIEFNPDLDYFLVCNTEMNSNESISGFIKILEEAAKQ